MVPSAHIWSACSEPPTILTVELPDVLVLPPASSHSVGVDTTPLPLMLRVSLPELVEYPMAITKMPPDLTAKVPPDMV